MLKVIRSPFPLSSTTLSFETNDSDPPSVHSRTAKWPVPARVITALILMEAELAVKFGPRSATWN